MKILTTLSLTAGILCSLNAFGDDSVKTLENLERERAALIGTLMDAELTPAERARRIEQAKRRLIDMERMVIRDDRLVGSRAYLVKNAFANYDLTFLINASVEHRRHVADHWLAQLGIDTRAVLTADSGSAR